MMAGGTPSCAPGILVEKYSVLNNEYTLLDALITTWFLFVFLLSYACPNLLARSREVET
jgi:hypothetical protein